MLMPQRTNRGTPCAVSLIWCNNLLACLTGLMNKLQALCVAFAITLPPLPTDATNGTANVCCCFLEHTQTWMPYTDPRVSFKAHMQVARKPNWGRVSRFTQIHGCICRSSTLDMLPKGNIMYPPQTRLPHQAWSDTFPKKINYQLRLSTLKCIVSSSSFVGDQQLKIAWKAGNMNILKITQITLFPCEGFSLLSL